MTVDIHKNFAYSLVATAPSPANTGTSLVVTAAQGARFPTAPFNATVWPVSTQPTSTNSEIVRVTAVSTDTLTITRAQEGTAPRTIIVGDQIAATLTTKTLTDAEQVIASWSPANFISSAVNTSVAQTLASATSQSSTGSIFVFPVTIPANLAFNQIVLPNYLSQITLNATLQLTNAYSSKFGIYSMSGNTLNLISSNSFSIGETLTSVSLSWNYPTSTATSGYGYGGFPTPQGSLTTTAQFTSYIGGTRAIGLQFGGNMFLSNGIYWLALLSNRMITGGTSTLGLSHLGIAGNAVNTINQVGSAAGLMPIGYASSRWTSHATHSTFWYGRHIMGFVTATSLASHSGTGIPPSISLSAIVADVAASLGTVMPLVTFLST